VEINIARVPRRERGMTPYECMLSESQERMLIVAKRGREQEVLEIFRRWDLDAAVIGKVTSTGKLTVLDDGRVAAELPIDPLTAGAPLYDRPIAQPEALEGLRAFDPLSVPAPKDLGEALLRILSQPTIASKQWVYEQYDHMVRLGAVLRPGRGDAAVGRRAGFDRAPPPLVACHARLPLLEPLRGPA